MQLMHNAIETLQQGGIIAYPTEAVYGLGCDPFNEQAVTRILELKQRSIDKGLILIAASWQQVQALTQSIPNEVLQKALDSWPGPYTWIFSATTKVPKWITGSHDTIALRVTAHPIAKAICEAYNGPIVSTSANIEGKTPAKTYEEVQQQFPQGIDYIVPGDVGNLAQPTAICDVLTDKVLRM